MTSVLHFSIGPVQGFVAEARRTRDWWAGSFLLSWLTAQAMRAVEDGFPFGDGGYGMVTAPVLTGDPMWQAMGDPNSTWPIGTLPNRFRAVLARPEDWTREKPSEAALSRGWEDLAEAVWDWFLGYGSMMDWEAVGGRDHYDMTRNIWDRQVKGFWEISWVLGETSDVDDERIDAFWLDRRKNWRSHPRPDEPGDHCRMMGDRQELSGLIRARERELQDVFWHELRGAVWRRIYPELSDRDPDRAEGELLELGVSERLCAIALIKRLFPLLPEQTLQQIIGWNPYGLARSRSEPSADRAGAMRYWPSTSYIAAVPWMIQAYQHAGSACLDFAATAERELYLRAVSERQRRTDPTRERSRVPGLAGAFSNQADFGALDGTLLFMDVLEAEIARARRDHDQASGDDRLLAKARLDAREAMQLALQRLLAHVALGEDSSFRIRKFRSPAAYFALLVMDGDSTGKLIAERGGACVSRALQVFAGRVAGPPCFQPAGAGGIVGKHDGVLIYAGGDDVQALLPLTTALAAVRDLHAAYLEAFQGELGDALGELGTPPTISAGLVIAHFQEPLGAVVREAHDLLERRAKGENGRNSLALALLRPSGSRLELVTAFGRKRATDEIEPGPIDVLDELAAAYAMEPGDRATSFLYRVRQRYGLKFLEGPDHGDDRPLFQGGDREDLLLAEWLKGHAADAKERCKAREAIGDLLTAGTVSRPGRFGARAFTLTGGLLARFLADHGLHEVPARFSSDPVSELPDTKGPK
jgi:CRISPR-associated protein Cmr2